MTRSLPGCHDLALWLMVCASVSSAAPLAAQVVAAQKKPSPGAQNVSFKSRDGVLLAATYYPSPLEQPATKDAAPVILLHAFRGSRADFAVLAAALQNSGCAVLVPDLRGHGQSTRQSQSYGAERSINVALLNKQDMANMVEYDLEACKSFLMEKNNTLQLNIDKLCVVGAEMGAGVAINWAAWDWHWPRLATGKQGQDVKALVLLSPQWSVKGMTISTAMGERGMVEQLSWMVVVGATDSTKELGEAKRLEQAIEKWVPHLSKPTGKPGLDYRALQTSLQSTKLLAAPSLASDIVKFIDAQVAKTAHPWTDRKGPL